MSKCNRARFRLIFVFIIEDNDFNNPPVDVTCVFYKHHEYNDLNIKYNYIISDCKSSQSFSYSAIIINVDNPFLLLLILLVVGLINLHPFHNSDNDIYIDNDSDQKLRISLLTLKPDLGRQPPPGCDPGRFQTAPHLSDVDG